MKTKRVRDFMAKHYTTVSPEQSLATAVRTPVVEAGVLVGIVSRKDILKALID